MKKIGAFLLTLAACLSFTACGSKKSKTKESTKKVTTKANTRATTKSGTKVTTKSDSDNTFTSKSLDEVLQAFNGKFYFRANMPHKNGSKYESVEASLAVDTKGSKEKLYAETPEGAMYFVEYETESFIYYTYDTDLNLYNGLTVISSDMLETLIDIEDELSIACGLTIKYTAKDEAFDFLNRNCTQYLNVYTEGSAEITEQYVIDNLTGICLKHSKMSSANPGVEIIDKTTFEILEFELTTGVDSCFDSQDTCVYVEPWYTTFFNANGLDDTVPFHVDINDILDDYLGETTPDLFLVAATSGHDDGHQYSNTTSFAFEGTKQDNSDLAMWIITNLYNCGAKYDATGNEKYMFELFEAEKEEETDSYFTSISFSAYANATTTSYLTIEYNADDDEAYLTIELIDDTLNPDGIERFYKQIDYDDYLEVCENRFKIDATLPYYDQDSQEYTTIEVLIAYCDGNIIAEDPSGRTYFKLDNGTYKFYYWTPDGYKRGDDSNLDMMDDIIEQLQIAFGMDIYYTAKESTIYLDRYCTKFINESIDPDTNATITYEYIIDNLIIHLVLLL